MKKDPIVVNGESFGTKGALEARAKAILNAYPFDARLSLDDFGFIRALLDRHPEASDKIGAGVAAIDVRREWRGTRHFVIIRVDGSTTDFSYRSCITPKTDAANLRQACRTAVRDQVIAFKRAAFAGASELTCPVALVAVTEETAHVDHAPPWTFDSIVKMFVAKCGNPPIEPTKDNSTETRFARDIDAERFRIFHDERASLRIVSAKANLSDLRKGQR